MNDEYQQNELKTQWVMRMQALPLNAASSREADALQSETDAAGTVTVHGQKASAEIRMLPLWPDQGDGLTGCAEAITAIKRQSELAEDAFLRPLLTALETLPPDHPVHIQGPFGVIETVYPVTVQEDIVGVLWSGKYLEAPLDAARVNRDAAAMAVDPTWVHNQLAAVPVFSVAERARHERALCTLQTLAAWVYRETLHSGTMVRQQLDSERMRALGTLSGGIAHHFNNLLSIILGYSSHLAHQDDLPPHMLHPVREISDAAQRGRRLTEEILSFAGSEVEEETRCSVHDILNNICPLLEAHTGTRFRLQRELHAEHDTVRSQSSVLHQSLFNFIMNELESAPEGGQFVVRTENRQAQNDSGMEEQIRIEISHPQVTHNDTLSDRAEIVLTLESPPVVVAEAKKPTRQVAGNTIWVVDDDPIFCEMCARVLGDDGHTIVTIPSGPDLQAQWEGHPAPPDLLIVDFSMPELSGLELSVWLREKGCRAPIVLVSGFSHTHPDIHQALKMRKIYFLQKPFPVPELADIVSVALGETLLGRPQ